MERVTDRQRAKVILRLLNVWLAHPDMRLAQLIASVYHPWAERDPCCLTDEDFVGEIERFYDTVVPVVPARPRPSWRRTALLKATRR
jgi:hypothetical protein